MSQIKAVRGMNDILPEHMGAWHFFENAVKRCLSQYGYQEIRFPLVESTHLFKRAIGQVTDIVEKEMYTFNDLNGDSLTLRPEGTAGCVRACLEHGLLYNQQQKLWYFGPMYRHERPQKGRYRQFYQLGVEVLGIAGAAIEIELIAMCQRLWALLGIGASVSLQINSLGELDERNRFKEALVHFLEAKKQLLDEDSQRRLYSNPLRILDSKHEKTQALLHDAPQLHDFLGEHSKAHFEGICHGLNTLGIPYEINPRLVRGLDYYGHTVFEWVTSHLGSQATVCAGGRYDALVEQIGGAPTPAVGFAMGVERLLLLMSELNQEKQLPKPLIFYIISSGETALHEAMKCAETIRNQCPDVRVVVNTSGGSLKSQFKKADKSQADYALILAETELETQTVGIKNLRAHAEQVSVGLHQLTDAIQSLIVAFKPV